MENDEQTNLRRREGLILGEITNLKAGARAAERARRADRMRFVERYDQLADKLARVTAEHAACVEDYASVVKELAAVTAELSSALIAHELVQKSLASFIEDRDRKLPDLGEPTGGS